MRQGVKGALGALGGLGSAEHEGQQSDLPVELEPRDCVLQEAGAFKEDVLQATGTSERQKDDQELDCDPPRDFTAPGRVCQCRSKKCGCPLTRGGGADAAVEGLPWKGRSTASCASGTDRKSQATWPTKTCPWLTGGPQDPGIPEMKRSVHSRTMHETVSGRLLSVLGCVLRPSGVLSWNVVAPGRPGENQPHPPPGCVLFSGPTGRLDRDFAFPKGEIVLAGRELDASGR